MEPDQIDILAFTVLRDLKQIEHAQEPGFSRQLWSDIREPDRRNRIHFDLALIHAIPATNLDMWTRPYADTASDFSTTNTVAQAFREYHSEVFPIGAATAVV